MLCAEFGCKPCVKEKKSKVFHNNGCIFLSPSLGEENAHLLSSFTKSQTHAKYVLNLPLKRGKKACTNYTSQPSYPQPQKFQSE